MEGRRIASEELESALQENDAESEGGAGRVLLEEFHPPARTSTIAAVDEQQASGAGTDGCDAHETGAVPVQEDATVLHGLER